MRHRDQQLLIFNLRLSLPDQTLIKSRQFLKLKSARQVAKAQSARASRFRNDGTGNKHPKISAVALTKAESKSDCAFGINIPNDRFHEIGVVACIWVAATGCAARISGW